MIAPLARRYSISAAVVGLLALGFAALAAFAIWSPNSRFLVPDSRATWILYPVPPRANIIDGKVEQHAVFQRRFALNKPSKPLKLEVRSLGACEIHLNGTRIELPFARNCNEICTCTLPEGLAAGVHELRAIVANDSGPPVLWLVLQAASWSIPSDEQWLVTLDGAVEVSAHPAEQILPLRPGNQSYGGTPTLVGLRASWPLLAFFAAATALLLWMASVAFQRMQSSQSAAYRFSPLTSALLLSIVLWIILFGHNTYSVPLFSNGFDVDAHMRYIGYIQEHHSLPLADEGWEMHHPPLYHFLAALLLSLCGLSVHDPGALVVLRLLGLALGIGELTIVAAIMRLVFPKDSQKQIAGLIVAAFVPANIYLCHYITNETLVMLLGSAALYYCLRILNDEKPAPRLFIALGICLGGAMLAKVSAVVVAGVVFGVLAGRLFWRRERSVHAWCAGFALPLAVTALVSGWHYWRVWHRFGTPLVGNYDALSGYRFWQDPGCCTIAYLFSFGTVLSDPYFASLYSLSDGMYSTLWGDGLCGGEAFWNGRPPWNYDLMSAGYLLALLPTVLILVGLAEGLLELILRPRSHWFLVLGLLGAFAAGNLFQLVRYAYSGHAKAIYLMVGLTPLAILGAVGFSRLTQKHRVLQAFAAILLGTWACASYASFWIVADSAATQNWAGMRYSRQGQTAEALRSFRKAIEIDPHAIEARINEAGIYGKTLQSAKVRQLCEEVLREDPKNPEALMALGILAQSEGRSEQASKLLGQTAVLAPDHPLVWPIIGQVCMLKGTIPDAILAYRKALRITPASAPSVHANLGLLLAQSGQTQEAIAQYRQALSILPSYDAWKTDLAWILATHAGATSADGPEAVQLALQGCKTTASAEALEALAAAYARDQKYWEAVASARRGLEVAGASGQIGVTKRLEEELKQYEAGKPLQAKGLPRSIPYPPTEPPEIAK